MPRPREVLEISVSRRMLWVGSAAFPLQSIARVEAFKIKPDRAAALTSFLKWLGGLALVYVVIAANNRDSDNDFEDNGGSLFVAVLVGLVIYLFKELLEPAKPVLAVETAGGSFAVVTLPSVDQLRTIAGQIVNAIDHPDAEFRTYANQLTNYNGPVIIQNGSGNTGIRL
ncbi:DUF6232 family protein [Streptomyces sp. NPDC002308]